MTSLSAIILTKNSQDTIVDCIESVSFCDEIIIIDDYSSDNTVDLIKSFNHPDIKFVKHHLENNFAKQRNFAISRSTSKWILFVDSDEAVSEELGKSIKRAIESDLYDGYLIRRVDFLWGRKLLHGETAGIALLRLAKKDRGHWAGKVHEEWKIQGKISEIKGQLLHCAHKSIFGFVAKINRYTTIRALELYMQGVKVSLFSVLLYPLAKFLVNYFIKRGFLDGDAGFIHACLMSFHSFLVRSKLFLLQSGITKNPSFAG